MSPTLRLPMASRNAAIVTGVVALHVAALWALQSGLVRQAVETVLPVAILAQLIEPPTPEPLRPAPQPPAPRTATPVRKQTPPPAPRPLAVPQAEPSQNAVQGVAEVQPPAPVIAAPALSAAPPAAPPAPPAPPAPARLVLPSSEADYLRNPSPPYPAMSKKLGEEGRVLLRVLISATGQPEQVELKRSSGFERLDSAALTAVRGWRFTPGTRDGIAEAMWRDLPFDWQLRR